MVGFFIYCTFCWSLIIFLCRNSPTWQFRSNVYLEIYFPMFSFGRCMPITNNTAPAHVRPTKDLCDFQLPSEGSNLTPFALFMRDFTHATRWGPGDENFGQWWMPVHLDRLDVNAWASFPEIGTALRFQWPFLCSWKFVIIQNCVGLRPLLCALSP